MKNSIRWIAPVFNTHRMVAEYVRRFYNPAAARWRYLTADSMAKAKALAAWKANLKKAWANFAIRDVKVEVYNGKGPISLSAKQSQLRVGAELDVSVLIRLGNTNPEDVSVELYHGPVDAWGNIREGDAVEMTYKESAQNGEYWFGGRLACRTSGRRGFTVRVLPHHSDLVTPYEPGLILWESPAESRTS
jgi:starch phosphorylase